MAQLKEEVKGEQQLSIWRNRDFLLLWAGQDVSALGSTMSGFALTLLILALTNSPAVAGFAAALSGIPYVVLSLPAGALVDRWDRKWVMIVCDAVRAANMGVLGLAVLFGWVDIWLIYVVALVEGCCITFFTAAVTAAIPQVVGKPQLGQANSAFYATGSAIELVGPPLGGFLFKSVGRAFPFLLDAVSYAASVVSLAAIRTRFQQERVKTERNLWVEIKEGIGWIWRRPFVKTMALLNFGVNAIDASMVLIVIVLARQLGADEPATGAILSAGAGGALLISVVNERLRRGISYSQIIVGTFWLRVVILLLYLLVPNVWVLGLVVAIYYINAVFYDINQYTYRLALIPDRLQGRVNSAFRLVAWSIRPLSAAVAGVLLERVGPQWTLLVFAGWVAVFAVLASFSREVRDAPPLEQLVTED